MQTPDDRRKKRRGVVTAVGFILVLLVGFLDYLTGVQISFSIFYVLPLAFVAWYAGKWEGVLAAVLSAIAWLIADLLWEVPYSYAVIPYWNAAVRLFLFLIVVYLLSGLKKMKEDLEDMVEERTAAVRAELAERIWVEKEVRRSHEQLRQLAASLQVAREEERTAVAREIHDELGQILTGLKMDISWLERKLSSPDKTLQQKTTAMAQIIDSTMHIVQRISAKLRPGILDHLGLVAAVEWQAKEFQKRTGIECNLASDSHSLEVEEDRKTALFRIFQETLTNVARHSRASLVKIYLRREPDKVILQVEDNGRGITEEEIFNPKSLGILGMKERAHHLGGELEVRGSPGRGTNVTVKLPLVPSVEGGSL